MNGQVVRLVKDRGFGFIRSETGDEYFFHLDNLTGLSWLELTREFIGGQNVKVSFDLVPSPKGVHAINIARQ